MTIRDKRKRRRAKPSVKSTSTPHDALFHRTFSVPKNAASELRCILDKELVDVIEWPSLHLESTKFVGTDLTSDFSDVLYSVNVRGHKTLFHILFEHESGYKPWPLLQALRYQVDRWEEIAAQPIERGDKRLPPILTVILHHGDDGWTASHRFQDYFKLDDDLARLFAPYLVDYHAIVDDMTKVHAEALLRRPVTLAARITLICFRFVREPARLVAELLKIKDELQEFFQRPEGNACLRGVFTYLDTGAKVPRAELKMAVHQLTGDPDIDEILWPGRQKKLWEAQKKRLEAQKKRLEAKVQEAERKALEAQREAERKALEAQREAERKALEAQREAERKALEAQHEAERKAQEAAKKLLQQQLGRRFGPLPPDAIAFVQAAASNDIEEMAMRVLTAQSLDEVLGRAKE